MPAADRTELTQSRVIRSGRFPEIQGFQTLQFVESPSPRFRALPRLATLVGRYRSFPPVSPCRTALSRPRLHRRHRGNGFPHIARTCWLVSRYQPSPSFTSSGRAVKSSSSGGQLPLRQSHQHFNRKARSPGRGRRRKAPELMLPGDPAKPVLGEQ